MLPGRGGRIRVFQMAWITLTRRADPALRAFREQTAQEQAV